jgi:hypothetical protein
MLSSHLMAPRKGHLEQFFHIFAYLDTHKNSTTVFDSSYFNVNDSQFTMSDWSQFYPGAAKTIPPNMPRSMDLPLVVTYYCNADHAECRVTQRSHSGIIVYVNNAPITWYSKQQSMVESLTFALEFVAMHTAVEQIKGLQCTLQIMSVPIEGTVNVFCGNQSVLKNC